MRDALTSKERLFHNLGPETAKAQSPLDLRHALGIVISNLFEDLSDTFAFYGLISSTKYSGAVALPNILSLSHVVP